MNQTEFERTICEQGLPFWRTVTKERMGQCLGAEFRAMVDFPQRNPHHCFDLMEHTLHTVEQIPAGNRELRTAAFFHDCAKPAVAQWKGTRQVFYGHAARSAIQAEKALRNLGYPEKSIRRSCFLVAHHDDFISWRTPAEYRPGPYITEIRPDTLRRYQQTVMESEPEVFAGEDDAEIWSALFCLCAADIRAQAKTARVAGRVVDIRAQKLARINALAGLCRCAAAEY